MKIAQDGERVLITLENFTEMAAMLNEGFLPLLKRERKVKALSEKLGVAMCMKPDCFDCQMHKTILAMGDEITKLADTVLTSAINEGQLSDEMAKRVIRIMEEEKARGQ